MLDLQEQGFEIGRHQLRKIMKEGQLQAIQPRSFVPRTTNSNHAGPHSPNLLLDRPVPTRPGEVLVTVDDNMEEVLVHSALQKAINYNQLGKGSIIHSDRAGPSLRGAVRWPPWRGREFRKTLRLHQFEQSMSGADEVYDNAFIESYWWRLKAELVHQRVFRSVADAREQLFEYIELYYNRRRRHSSLGYVSPLQFEEAYYRNNLKTVS